ncbi:MAG: alanine racemase [Ignavibacteriales bacterium CG07_land_8_20_14_0_80_59_12]|nr:MAG: alanine racemase [Ignavibacteriales bacterium CG07_land_8_20_14_0_80_59_12]
MPTRPGWVEVNLDAFSYNLRGVRKRVGFGVKIMAVVKANAYGHGSVEIAREALAGEADCLAVAFPEEAIALRDAGLSAETLVFTSPMWEQMPLYFDYKLIPAVASIDVAARLEEEAQKRNLRCPVHVKVDTGMGRLGFEWNSAADSIVTIARMPHLEITGVFSHFAAADEADKSFSENQLQRFGHVLDALGKLRIEVQDVHMAGSAGILDLPESYFTMVRPGIMLYGYYPSQETTESVPLRPVMSIKSRVVFAKRVAEATSISYGRRYYTTREVLIATIPVGYADGLSRRLTNRASVLIGGRRYPVVGTIAMDHVMVDVGDDHVAVGDEVVFIGTQGGNQITAWDVARLIDTIPYEITCSVSPRVPRVFVRDSRPD